MEKLSIITKDYYYKLLWTHTPKYTKYLLSNTPRDFLKHHGFFRKYPYLLIPGKGVFVYFPDLEIILIPDGSGVSLEDINSPSTKLTLEEWSFVPTSSDTKYTLNAYKRFCGDYFNRIDRKIIKDGTYLLHNDISGEDLEFSTRFYDSEYWCSAYFCIPEVLEFPAKSDLIDYKLEFIKNILTWNMTK